MMFKLFFIITLLFPIDNQIFKVNFFGFPAARVELNVNDTLYNGNINKLITFKTHSISLIKYMFNVNNQYQTITSKDIRNILFFSKNTSQPNVINQLQTSRINKKTIYNNSSIEIPENNFNIFSLLYFLSQNKIIDSKNINIEREGLLYIGKITPIKIFDDNKVLYNLDLILDRSISTQPLINNTDIFTWALFKKNTIKEILVDYNNNIITECIFQSGRIKMIAQNINHYK